MTDGNDDINFRGVVFFKSKKYFNIFHKIFYDITNTKRIFKLYECTNSKRTINYFPLKEKNKNGYWINIFKSFDTPIYLDFSYKKVDSIKNAEYITNELLYKYIQYFCYVNLNRLKVIAVKQRKSLKTIKSIYINICARLSNNENLTPKKIIKNGKIDYISLSNSKKKMERASLYITEKFTSIICEKDKLEKNKTRASILEKYNALKNLTNELNDVLKIQEEKDNKLELKYFIKTGRPIGYITDKFIGPTDEKSLIMKQRKIFIHHKLRENAINHIEEKKSSTINSQTNFVVNDIKKSNFNSFANFNKGKKIKIRNRYNLPSINTCYSNGFFLIGLNKKSNLSKNMSTKNIKNSHMSFGDIQKRNLKLKTSKSSSKINKMFFITKSDLFY